MPAPLGDALPRALFWFRRDLRPRDNAGLWQALSSAGQVHCVFVFDREILDALPSPADRRVEFIWHSVRQLGETLASWGGLLTVVHGHARQEIPALATRLGVQAVYTNRDYEPAARVRDAHVAAALGAQNIAFHTVRDQVIFEEREILTQGGKPFSVFTPYRNAWMKALTPERLAACPVEAVAGALAGPPGMPAMPSLEALGFQATNLLPLGIQPGASGAQAAMADFIPRMDQYAALRDFPGRRGVSYLSVHQRFGTLSIREAARQAVAAGALGVAAGASAWLNELVWRDFYFQILANFPHAAQGAFKREYDALAFPSDPALFQAWQAGLTGYPLVDAAMRQLQQTGYMHNRLRMVAASYLVKDLAVHWQWGERHFAEQLNDFDLAANNGGWQWAASTGCDAQPYFRIFNPVTQSERFDPDGRFIRRYVPELADVPLRYLHAPWTMPPLEQAAANCVVGKDYPAPVVDHGEARLRALALYQAVR